MGSGYSKRSFAGDTFPLKLHSLHRGRLQEMREFKSSAKFHGEGSLWKKMPLCEPAKKEDGISTSHSNDRSKHEASKLEFAKPDERLILENSFKSVVPIACSVDESSQESDEDEMHSLLQDEDDNGCLAERMSDAICCAKEDDAEGISDVKKCATANLSQEQEGNNANKRKEIAGREEEEEEECEDDDYDEESSSEGDLSSGPPSFRIYCVPPSLEMEQQQEEENRADSVDDSVQVYDGSNGHSADLKRTIGDSFGSVMSNSSYTSNEVVQPNEKKQRRKKKLAKAIKRGPAAVRNMIIRKAGLGGCTPLRLNKVPHDGGRIMSARSAH